MSSMAEIQYLCPNCFCQRSANDVLFARNAIKRTQDTRKARYWSRFHPLVAAPRDTRFLADWRTYPAGQCLYHGDAIVGIMDYSGEKLTQRICPECHYPALIPQEPKHVLVPWKKGKADPKAGAAFLDILNEKAGWKTTTVQADPDRMLQAYCRADLEAGTLLVPMQLCGPEGPMDESIFTRYLENANAGLVWLELDPIREKQPCRDDDAIEDLICLAATKGFVGAKLNRPTAVLLSGPDTMPVSNRELMAWLEENHRNLVNAMLGLLGSFCAFTWSGREEAAALEAATWILAPTPSYARGIEPGTGTMTEMKDAPEERGEEPETPSDAPAQEDHSEPAPEEAPQNPSEENQPLEESQDEKDDFDDFFAALPGDEEENNSKPDFD